MTAFVLRVFGFLQSFRLFGCAAKFDFDIGLFAAAPNAQSNFFARIIEPTMTGKSARTFFPVHAAVQYRRLVNRLVALRCSA